LVFTKQEYGRAITYVLEDVSKEIQNLRSMYPTDKPIFKTTKLLS